MIHPHDIFSHKEPWTIRIKSLALELKKKGHEITLISFTLDGFENKPFSMEGIKYITFSRKLSLKYFFQKIQKLKKIFVNADIIYFQKCFHFTSVPTIIASVLANKKIHYDWDDNESAIYFSGEKPPSLIIGICLKLLELFIPKIADTVSVSSESLYKKAQKLGVPENRLIKVPVGSTKQDIDNNKIETIKDKFKLTFPSQIYVGQLHGGQYAELVLYACKKLKNSGIKSKTLIIGDGHDKNRLEHLKNNLGLNNEVIFTGAIPHKEIFSYLKASDIAIAAFEKNNVTISKSPLKIVEYLNAGKAIVAHDVGEVAYMLNDCGILANPDDPDSLYLKLKELHENSNKIKLLENKALKQSEKLRWSNSAEKLDILFLQVKA